MERTWNSENAAGTNLKTKGQNYRLRMGVIMLGVSLLATVLLVQADFHRAWRAVLFLPFFMAAFGAWQGLFRTCPGLAMKGVRESACGGCDERIGHAKELVVARHLARQVLLGAIVTAVFSTFVVVLIP
ncbi:MAG: hypothetical protein AAFN74_03860 [Myxococcota bacterium]